jgi:hypothetical protein
VKDDSGLHNENTDDLAGEESLGALLSTEDCLGTNFGRDDALANVFDEEREEETSQEDSGSGSLIAQVTNAGVTEHHVGMGVKLSCSCKKTIYLVQLK